jgi:PIN domain nuclease of toxin-antitoxin system
MAIHSGRMLLRQFRGLRLAALSTFSPVSAWEIGFLVRRGRLELGIAAETYIEWAVGFLLGD